MEAMIREFREETGLEITNWKQFAVLEHIEEGWRIFCFHSSLNEIPVLIQMTDEKVIVIDEVDLISNENSWALENIPWLLLMIKSQAIDKTDCYNIEYIR